MQEKLFVGLPAHSAGNFGPFCTICRVPARSAGKLWAFCSVSGEIPAHSAGKFLGQSELFGNYSCSAARVRRSVMFSVEFAP